MCNMPRHYRRVRGRQPTAPVQADSDADVDTIDTTIDIEYVPGPHPRRWTELHDTLRHYGWIVFATETICDEGAVVQSSIQLYGPTARSADMHAFLSRMLPGLQRAGAVETFRIISGASE